MISEKSKVFLLLYVEMAAIFMAAIKTSAIKMGVPLFLTSAIISIVRSRHTILNLSGTILGLRDTASRRENLITLKLW